MNPTFSLSTGVFVWDTCVQSRRVVDSVVGGSVCQDVLHGSSNHEWVEHPTCTSMMARLFGMTRVEPRKIVTNTVGGSKGCDQLRDVSNHVRVKPGKWTGEGTHVDGTR